MRNASNRIRRTVIHEATLPCDVPLNELDMDWLRRRFSTLFDEAALAVNRAGYDLDDVVFDRFIAYEHKGAEPVEVALPSLTDPTAVVSAVPASPDEGHHESARPPQPRIVALRVVVILEQW